MATTTPNFGWVVPTSTDLVKNGATAIETLGDSIDASMAELKGGTTGQVLSKTSNTDMDFTWVAQDDSNAIQNAIVDAKGDLIAATAADTPARLAVGTNGQVLTADSTAATGLAWASAATSSGPAFNAYRLSGSGTQSITNGVNTKIALDGEYFDTDSNYSTANYRFTPTKAGYYQINATFAFGGTTSRVDGSIWKNGSESWRTLSYNAATPMNVSGGNVIYFNGTTDYIEAYIYMTGTSLILYADYYGCTLSGFWIRS
jgi:hypothetical protein